MKEVGILIALISVPTRICLMRRARKPKTVLQAQRKHTLNAAAR